MKSKNRKIKIVLKLEEKNPICYTFTQRILNYIFVDDILQCTRQIYDK